MKVTYYSLLFSILLFLWTNCSKDKELTNENTEETTAQSVSNINKSPSLLLGSWNLTKDNSLQNSEKTTNDCKASNIHFLENLSHQINLSFFQKKNQNYF